MLIHVIAACHNRRTMTVRALTCCASSADAAGVEVRFFLYDDGSTDGTAEAVQELGLDVDIVRGDGSAFWARGMAEAERAAVSAGAPDSLLWLNDDVQMDIDALSRLIEESREFPGAILVGAVRDGLHGGISFSAYRRLGRHPLRLRSVVPGGAPQAVDTMNGNVVLVPSTAAQRIGGIDGGFSHGLADIDYGLRACDAGVPVVLGSGTFGECPPTPDRWYPRDYATVRAAWRGFIGIKGGGHPRSLVRILRRHAPVMWVLYLARTYAIWWGRTLSRAASRHVRRQRPAA